MCACKHVCVRVWHTRSLVCEHAKIITEIISDMCHVTNAPHLGPLTTCALVLLHAFAGSSAVNPATGEAIPVWVADYVLGGYGSGAIMAVPSHDTRDAEFAATFQLPTRAVVAPAAEGTAKEASVSPAAEGTKAFAGELRDSFSVPSLQLADGIGFLLT